MRKNQDLIASFIEHSLKSPHKKAVATSNGSLTYQELYQEVVTLKYFIKKYNLKGPVAVCLDRTPLLIATLLALQWLKITYIPLEPSTPRERLRTIIEDSRACAVLYDKDSFISLIRKTPPSCHFSQEVINPAYIIYTSGSTGKPKGVAISYKALNHFLACMKDYFLKAKNETLLAITTITFDIAALELYLPLSQGKTVFLTNQKEHLDPLCIAKILQQYPITLMQATPSMWNMLKNINWEGSPNLVALSGGERLTDALVEYLLPKVSELWNMYGPTEAPIWCALKKLSLTDPISVGLPIKGMHMEVVDKNWKKLPPYVKGELIIRGVCLADGYVNNLAKTQEKFVIHPKRKTKVYLSGDIACQIENGEFIIFGRQDNQIKLHGYRIELEEIEHCVQKL